MSLEALKPVFDADAEAYIKRLAGWPYASMATEATRWAERKYHFAREIWNKRDEFCPGRKTERGERMTWAQRFAEMWHEPLEDYVQRCKTARTKVAA